MEVGEEDLAILGAAVLYPLSRVGQLEDGADWPQWDIRIRRFFRFNDLAEALNKPLSPESPKEDQERMRLACAAVERTCGNHAASCLRDLTDVATMLKTLEHVFKEPASTAFQRVFLEFEALRYPGSFDNVEAYGNQFISLLHDLDQVGCILPQDRMYVVNKFLLSLDASFDYFRTFFRISYTPCPDYGRGARKLATLGDTITLAVADEQTRRARDDAGAAVEEEVVVDYYCEHCNRIGHTIKICHTANPELRAAWVAERKRRKATRRIKSKSEGKVLGRRSGHGRISKRRRPKRVRAEHG
ncbi:MAG: hypothetical protein Q9212_003719 [Teloschistes hypoglaucus]